MARVLVINGHPDPSARRLCAALCDAYGRGALAVGLLDRMEALGRLRG